MAAIFPAGSSQEPIAFLLRALRRQLRLKNCRCHVRHIFLAFPLFSSSVPQLLSLSFSFPISFSLFVSFFRTRSLFLSYSISFSFSLDLLFFLTRSLFPSRSISLSCFLFFSSVSLSFFPSAPQHERKASFSTISSPASFRISYFSFVHFPQSR